MDKLVGIVILNWNGLEDSIQCVNSVLKATYPAYKIYLVDNGSTDNSFEVLTNTYRTENKVSVISTGENLGYSGGNNMGMRNAVNDGAAYVLLLNNDTEVEPDFIEPLVEALEENNDIGITTGKIYFHNTDKQIWFYGGLVDRDTAAGRAIKWEEFDTGQINKPIDVEFATGCVLLVRRKILETVGYLDDDFFYLCEDVEFCLRVADAGYRIVAVPDSIVWHKVTQSLKGGVDSPIRFYFMARNQLLQVRKTKNKKHPVLCWLKLIKINLKFILGRIRNRDPLKGTVYYIWGILDFLRGRIGNIPIVNSK